MRFIAHQPKDKLRLCQKKIALLRCLCYNLTEERDSRKQFTVSHPADIIRDRVFDNARGLQRGIIRGDFHTDIILCFPLHALCEHFVAVTPNAIKDIHRIHDIREIVQLHILVLPLFLRNEIKKIGRVTGINVVVILVLREEVGELRAIDRFFRVVCFQPEEVGDVIQPVPLIRRKAYRTRTEFPLHIGKQLIQPLFVLLGSIGARRRKCLLFLEFKHLRPFPRRCRLVECTGVLTLFAAEEARIAGFTDRALPQIHPRLFPQEFLMRIGRAFIFLARLLLCPASRIGFLRLRILRSFFLDLLGRIATKDTHQTLFAAQCGGFDGKSSVIRFRCLHRTRHVFIRQMCLHDLLVKIAGVFIHMRLKLFFERLALSSCLLIGGIGREPVHDNIGITALPHCILREIDRIVFEFRPLAFALCLYLLVELFPCLFFKVFHDTFTKNVLCLFLRLLRPTLVKLCLRLPKEGFNALFAKQLLHRAETRVKLRRLDFLLRRNHTRHDCLHLFRRHCAHVLCEIVDLAQERLKPSKYAIHRRRRGFPFGKVHLKATGKSLLPPPLHRSFLCNRIARLLRRKDRVLVVAELIGKVCPCILIRRTFVPLCPRIDRLKVFRRGFVHLRELVQIHQEHMPHLVHECRFIRTLKERNDTLSVLFGDFTMHLFTEHLVELLDDLDCLVVEDDKTAAVTLSIVCDALDTDLVQRERGGFVRVKNIRKILINVMSIHPINNIYKQGHFSLDCTLTRRKTFLQISPGCFNISNHVVMTSIQKGRIYMGISTQMRKEKCPPLVRG